VDGQAVKAKLIVALRKFGNASKNAAISVWFTSVANSKEQR
jgi:hypothetical protein